MDFIFLKTFKDFKDPWGPCEYFDEVVSQSFIPRITLPTRISEQSSTLIDNIYTNNIDERESAGILLNQISDHQMIFTLIENFSYVTQAPKFVEIQTNDPEPIQNFVNELDELNIYNHLQTAIDSSPDVNYHTILELLSTVKDKHLPKKMVKFNRKKHKKAKWMTNGILKSINTRVGKKTGFFVINRKKTFFWFNPIRSGGALKAPPPSDFLLSRI